MNDTPPLLQCYNLCKSYQEGKICTKVLHNINLSLNKGDLTAIIGMSGSGKSTLLQLLAGLDIPTSGEVMLNGQLMSTMSLSDKAKIRNREIGFVHQFHHLLPDFNVLENVAMPALIKKNNTIKAQEQAHKLLVKVGLEHRIKYYPSELSGGERQRVAIARALVNSPNLVMADEPTGNLDAYNAGIIFELLYDLNVQNATTLLVVTHDLNLAHRLNRQIEIRNGQLYEHE